MKDDHTSITKIWKQDKPTIRRVLESYWYLELCWGQAHAFINEPKQLFMDFLVVSIFLTSRGIDNNLLVILVFIVLGVAALTFGRYTVKRRWVDWHLSFYNKFDPEKMKILENTGGMKK